MEYVRLKNLIEAYTPQEANWAFQFVKLLVRHGYVNFADYDMAVDVFIVARECGHDVVFAEWHDTTTDGLPVSTYTIARRQFHMRKPERRPRRFCPMHSDDLTRSDVERIFHEIMNA